MDPATLGLLVPIIAIIFGVAVAIVAIVAAHRQRMQRAELRHRERLAAIEKGLELPPDPPDVDANGALRRPRFLLRGLVLLFVGITLTLAMEQLHESVPYLFGMIPAAAGLGYLIYYYIEGRREPSPAATGSPPDRSSRP
jgi:hypothetical protein